MAADHFSGVCANDKRCSVGQRPAFHSASFNGCLKLPHDRATSYAKGTSKPVVRPFLLALASSVGLYPPTHCYGKV